MEFSKLSIKMRNFLKQEYGDEKNVIEATKLFFEEGKNILLALGIEYDEKYDVFLDLYAEYKIYSAMGDEKLANLKLENFNKLIKNLSVSINAKKEAKDINKSKGIVIFND